MSSVILYPYNILAEDASVTVTGSPDSGYPESRLYDRSIDFYWKYTNTGDISIECDQGAAGILDVDFLGIKNHNFSGRTMYWEYSDNGSSWSDAVTSWSQGNNNQIIKTLAEAIAHRYWRVRVIGAVNPMCSEVWVSAGYEFRISYQGNPSGKPVPNVRWRETLGGMERSTKLGDVRKRRSYLFPHFSSEYTLASFREAEGYLDDYSKPLYIMDHEGAYWFARVVDTEEKYNTEETAERDIEFLEML
jgi:hypothetical protein